MNNEKMLQLPFFVVGQTPTFLAASALMGVFSSEIELRNDGKLVEKWWLSLRNILSDCEHCYSKER